MSLRTLCLCGMVVLSCNAATATLVHRYSFTSDASDSVGGAHGTVVDPGSMTALFAGGQLDVSANIGQGSNGITEDAYVNFPNGIVTAATNGGVAGQLSVEIWARSAENRNWAALFSAGTSNGGEDQSPEAPAADYIQLIPQNGQNGRLRATTHRANVGAEGFVDHGSAMSTSQTTQVVAVFDQSGGLPGTVSMYVDGSFIGTSNVAAGLNIGAMPDNNIWLGRSQWNDSAFDGSYDEFRIYDSALSAGEVADHYRAGPNVVPEATSIVLLALAACGLCVGRRRRR